MTTSQVTRVEKPWGYELHWAKTDRYVGKLIHINAGHALSLRYHNVKGAEAIYLRTGKMLWGIEIDGLTTENARCCLATPSTSRRRRCTA